MGARITGRIDPVQRTIGAYIPEGEPKARAEAFARFAIGERTRVERESYNGKPPRRTTKVDGTLGKSEFQVRPEGGRIEYEWDNIGPMLEWILDALFRASPVGPEAEGHYREDHELWINGQPGSPSNVPRNWSEIIIMNSRPYARKLERKYSIYETMAAYASRRFNNQARVKFTFRSPLGGYVWLGGRSGGKRASAGKRAAHTAETQTRVPALIIRPL